MNKSKSVEVLEVNLAPPVVPAAEPFGEEPVPEEPWDMETVPATDAEMLERLTAGVRGVSLDPEVKLDGGSPKKSNPVEPFKNSAAHDRDSKVPTGILDEPIFSASVTSVPSSSETQPDTESGGEAEPSATEDPYSFIGD